MARAVILSFALLFLSLPSFALAQNTPASDYQYQLDQYRRHYAEFNIFKKDYLNNNTLDNEQKAVLSAKDTLVARELTKASFVRVLKQLILKSQVNHPTVIATLASLDTLYNYHQKQVNQVKPIQTKKDLNAFTLAYKDQLEQHQLALDTAQVTNKLAQLLRFNQEIKTQIDLLSPQLEPKKDLSLVQSGLEEVASYQEKIDQGAETVIELSSQIKFSSYQRQNSLKKIVQQLSQIRYYQRKLVDRLIDLDKNYVER